MYQDDLVITIFHPKPTLEEWVSIKEEIGVFSPESKRFERLLFEPLHLVAKTVCLESHYICKDQRDLHTNFYSKRFEIDASGCQRAHFFDEIIEEEDFVIDPEKVNQSYIGFAVLRRVPLSEVGRLIIDPAKLGKSSETGHYLMKVPFKANVIGVDLTVEAFPHLSQDMEATVCAHASLWGVCRYLSQRYECYSEFLPFDLISRTSTERGRVMPYHGLTHTDYSRILTEFGCHPLTFEVIGNKAGEDNENEESAKMAIADLYSYVESGLPVLASLRGGENDYGHSVNLIGHTINESAAQRIAPDVISHQITVRNTAGRKKSVPVIDSASFLQEWVVSDDNHFPYQLLGKKGHPDNYAGDKHGKGSIAAVVCPLPGDVFLSASKARRAMFKILEKLIQDSPDRIPFSASNPLVSRLFITTGRALKRKKLEKFRKSIDLGNISGFLGLPLWRRMPHFVWVMEVSLRNEYFNDDERGQCVAEIVFDATASEFDKGAIYARLGTLFLVDRANSDEYRIEDKNEPTRFARYRHNLGS